MISRSFRASKTFTIFVVSVAIFTDTLLLNLIVPMLPYALESRVGLSSSDVQLWNSILLASYGGALMIGSLFFGWIGDRIPSRKSPYLFGLILLGASTLAFALGSTLTMLLIARVLQGFSGAIVFTVGYALLFDTVGRDRIGQAMGYTGVALNLGVLLGPVLGGFLYEYGGYFQVFLPALGLIVVEIILRLMTINEKKAVNRNVSRAASSKHHSNERIRARTGSSQYPERLPSGEGVPIDVEAETDALLPTAPSIRPKNALLTLLRSPRFVVAIGGLFTVNSICNGFDGVLPAYVHDTFGLNAVYAALLFLAMAAPMLIAPVSGAFTDKHGAKHAASFGLGFAIPSLILLRFVVPNSSWPFLKLAVLLFMFGIAVTFILPALMAEISLTVDDAETRSPGIFGPCGAYSQAYGLMNTAFAGGAMVGPLYAGFIRAWVGWSIMSLLMGLLCSVVIVPVLIFTGGKNASGEDEAGDTKAGPDLETGHERY